MKKKDPRLEKKIQKKMIENPEFRRELVSVSHKYFFGAYLGRYLKSPSAFFHHEMFAITENERIKLAIVMAFRGSGKSTIMNLSYALWAIMGKQKKKYIILVSKTRRQSKIQFENIKAELAGNELLKSDLGPFKTNEDPEWGTYTLELSHFNAKIMCVSAHQGVRGIRHGEHRPDLIICDDIEDTASTDPKGKDQERLYNWLKNELFPIGDKKTRIIVLGNLIGEHSVLLKLRENLGKSGIFRAYPFADDNGKVLWQEKFKTEKDIQELKETTSGSDAWGREYMLNSNETGESNIIVMTVSPQWRNNDGAIGRFFAKRYGKGKGGRKVAGYQISVPKVNPSGQPKVLVVLGRKEWAWLHDLPYTYTPPSEKKEIIGRDNETMLPQSPQ